MSQTAEVKVKFDSFFTTKNYTGILLHVSARMDDLRDDQIGKPFLTHTWLTKEAPDFDREGIEEVLCDRSIVSQSFEGNKIVLSATEGEAIGKAIDNANKVLKNRNKSS